MTIFYKPYLTPPLQIRIVSQFSEFCGIYAAWANGVSNIICNIFKLFIILVNNIDNLKREKIKDRKSIRKKFYSVYFQTNSFIINICGSDIKKV